MDYNVKVFKKNKEYARILLDVYAGDVSEDTAVNLYIFQSIFLKDEFPEISNTLKDIAINEMSHFYYLGEAIKLLGCVPIMGTVRNDDVFRLWNSGNVSFVTSLKSILNTDIESEETAINNYLRIYDLIDDIYIKDLIMYIINQEREHLKLFKDLYKRYILR